MVESLESLYVRQPIAAAGRGKWKMRTGRQARGRQAEQSGKARARKEGGVRSEGECMDVGVGVCRNRDVVCSVSEI